MADPISTHVSPETTGTEVNVNDVPSSSTSDEAAQDLTQPVETPTSVQHVSPPRATVTVSTPEDQPDEATQGRPSSVTDDQDGIEQPPTGSSYAEEHLTAGTANIALRAGHNSGQMIGQLFEAVQRHSGAELQRKWVNDELRNYAAIGNESELASRLHQNHVLVLPADHPGSGRWTTALHLLSNFREPQLTIRRIRRESGDSFDMAGLRGQRHTGWILDLRDLDESIPAKIDFGHELLQTSDLRADNSYLVVLVSTELWDRICYGATHLAQSLQPPAPIAQVSALLKSSGVTQPDSWAQKFADKVEYLRPAQVHEWAVALNASYHEFEKENNRSPKPDSEYDSGKITETVRNAVSGWMTVLMDWHTAPERTSYDRNYLLLAAVYGGAPIDAVHEKVASLAQALGEKGASAEPMPGQQGPGLVALAKEIHAELLPNGSLRFPGPGFTEAVVQYFWLDRPHLASQFMTWTVGLSLELRRSQGADLAGRIGPWVLHNAQATNSIRLLRLVATKWSENENLAGHAHDLLVAASLDDQIGSRTRKAMGAWVNQEGSIPPLLQTLARVFATLTPAHGQMLGRLADLARSSKDGVSDAVGQAIDELWDNRVFRPTLRSTLISWFSSQQEPLQRAAASAFLQLALQQDEAGNPILLQELDEPDWIIRGWRVALEEPEPSPLAYQAFSRWLDSAVIVDRFFDAIFSLLVRAVHDTPADDLRGRRLLNLGRIGERWVLRSNVLNEDERNEARHELEHRSQLADPHLTTMHDESGPLVD